MSTMQTAPGWILQTAVLDALIYICILPVAATNEPSGKTGMHAGGRRLTTFEVPFNESNNNSKSNNSTHDLVPAAGLPPAAANWNINPVVYLIGFVVMAVIMLGLLALLVLKHCYRRSPGVAAQTAAGADVNAVQSAGRHSVPQHVLALLPVVKYSTVHRSTESAAAHHPSSQPAMQQELARMVSRPGNAGDTAGLGESAGADEAAAAGGSSGTATPNVGRLSADTLGGGSGSPAAAAASSSPSTTINLSGTGTSGVLIHATSSVSSTGTTSNPMAVQPLGRPSCRIRSSMGRSCEGTNMSASDADVCAVCYEEFVSDDDVRQLPCGHFYHPACVDAWLEKDDTCPLCKGHVLTAVGGAVV